jgi:hypothetical protein
MVIANSINITKSAAKDKVALTSHLWESIDRDGRRSQGVFQVLAWSRAGGRGAKGRRVGWGKAEKLKS